MGDVIPIGRAAGAQDEEASHHAHPSTYKSVPELADEVAQWLCATRFPFDWQSDVPPPSPVTVMVLAHWMGELAAPPNELIDVIEAQTGWDLRGYRT